MSEEQIRNDILQREKELELLEAEYKDKLKSSENEINREYNPKIEAKEADLSYRTTNDDVKKELKKELKTLLKSKNKELKKGEIDLKNEHRNKIKAIMKEIKVLIKELKLLQKAISSY